jgi:hypothetical protein
VLGVWGGLYFLLGAVVVVSIVRWFLVNDAKNPTRPERGLFAMRDRRAKEMSKPWTPKAPN